MNVSYAVPLAVHLWNVVGPTMPSKIVAFRYAPAQVIALCIEYTRLQKSPSTPLNVEDFTSLSCVQVVERATMEMRLDAEIHNLDVVPHMAMNMYLVGEFGHESNFNNDATGLSRYALALIKKEFIEIAVRFMKAFSLVGTKVGTPVQRAILSTCFVDRVVLLVGLICEQGIKTRQAGFLAWQVATTGVLSTVVEWSRTTNVENATWGMPSSSDFYVGSMTNIIGPISFTRIHEHCLQHAPPTLPSLLSPGCKRTGSLRICQDPTNWPPPFFLPHQFPNPKLP